MAKLSAHGVEYARLVTSTTQEADDFDRRTHGLEVRRYEHHYSFRSDGYIMRRIVGLDVHPGETDPRYRRHDWGWKLWKRLSDPKRDTRRRQVALAHQMSVTAELRDGLIDLKTTPY